MRRLFGSVDASKRALPNDESAVLPAPVAPGNSDLDVFMRGRSEGEALMRARAEAVIGHLLGMIRSERLVTGATLRTMLPVFDVLPHEIARAYEAVRVQAEKVSDGYSPFADITQDYDELYRRVVRPLLDGTFRHGKPDSQDEVPT